MNQAKKTPRFEVITNTNDLEITFRDTGKKVKIEYQDNHWVMTGLQARPLSFGAIAQKVTELLCEGYNKGKFKSGHFFGQKWATNRFRNLISHILAPHLHNILKNQRQDFIELDRLITRVAGFNYQWRHLHDWFTDDLLNSQLYKDMQQYRIAVLACLNHFVKGGNACDINFDWKRHFAYKHKLAKNFIKTVKAINFTCPLHLLEQLKTEKCRRVCKTKSELMLYLGWLYEQHHFSHSLRSRKLEIEEIVIKATDAEIKKAVKLIRKFNYSISLRKWNGYTTLVDTWLNKMSYKQLKMGLVDGIKDKLMEMETQLRLEIALPENLKLKIHPLDYKKYGFEPVTSVKELMKLMKENYRAYPTNYVEKCLSVRLPYFQIRRNFAIFIR
jgi:hypothetical protein